MKTGPFMRAAAGVFSALLVVVVAACGSDKAAFTPLIEPRGDLRYDLLVENLPDVRSSQLAPGAAPARPVIDGDKATKTAHFLVTFSGEPDPATVGERIKAGLSGVSFLTVRNASMEGDLGACSLNVEYEMPGGEGTLDLEIKATDRPEILEVRYTVEEQL